MNAAMKNFEDQKADGLSGLRLGVIFVGLLALTGLLALLVGGCSRARLTDGQAAEAISEIISNSASFPGNCSPLYPATDYNAAELPWKVTVDISTSMKGYIIPNGQKTEFSQVLNRLSTRVGAEFASAGEAEEGETNLLTPTSIEDYLKTEFYNRHGADYSNTFQQFTTDSGHNHIFVTDGAFIWKRKMLNPQYLSGLLKRFLSRGGQFALIADQSQYSGQFTSGWNLLNKPVNSDPDDLLVSIDTNNRPFLLWVFVQPGQTLGTPTGSFGKLERLLGSGTEQGGPSWKVLLAQGRSTDHFELVGKSLPRMGNFDQVGDISKLYDLAPDGFAPTMVGDVYLSAGGSVRFNLDSRHNGLLAVDDSARNTHADVKLNTWELCLDQSNHVHLANLVGLPPVQQWRSYTNATAISGGSGGAGSTSGIISNSISRLELSQSRPKLSATNRLGLIAWMVTLTPETSSSQRETWAAISTDNDAREDQGDRIYHLNEYLEVLNEDCLVDDRFVFFTYWP